MQVLCFSRHVSYIVECLMIYLFRLPVQMYQKSHARLTIFNQVHLKYTLIIYIEIVRLDKCNLKQGFKSRSLFSFIKITPISQYK